MTKIPIKVYEEVKDTHLLFYISMHIESSIEWIDNNGINTPYFVTVVNKG